MADFLPEVIHNVFHSGDEVLSAASVLSGGLLAVTAGQRLKMAECRAAKDANRLGVSCYAGYFGYHMSLRNLSSSSVFTLEIDVNGRAVKVLPDTLLESSVGMYAQAGFLRLPFAIRAGDTVEAFLVSTVAYAVSASSWSMRPNCLLKIKYGGGA